MKGSEMIRTFHHVKGPLQHLTIVFLAFCAVMIALGLAASSSGCGAKLFPKCGELGVACPPCSGREVYPDPCAAAPRDAGAEAGR